MNIVPVEKRPRRQGIPAIRNRIVRAALRLADADEEARRLWYFGKSKDLSLARRRRVECRDAVVHLAKRLRERIEEEGGSSSGYPRGEPGNDGRA